MTKSMRARTKAFLVGLALCLSVPASFFGSSALAADPLPASITLGKKLGGVAVNNDTHEALVLSEEPARLHRIKLENRSVAALNLPEEAEVLAVDEKRNLALVAIEDKKLAFVDLAASQLLPETVSFEHGSGDRRARELGLAVLLADEAIPSHSLTSQPQVLAASRSRASSKAWPSIGTGRRPTW